MRLRDTNLALVCLFGLLSGIGAPALAAPIGNPIASTQSAAAEATHVFSNAPATLYGGLVTIGTTAGYLMLFNAVAAPADGAVTPKFCFQVPASTTYSFPLINPVPFTVGISAAFSTTGCFTKTGSNAYFAAQTR